MASNSSMKIMQGAWDLACSNRWRTPHGAYATNISTNSLPLREKKGTPASPAAPRRGESCPFPAARQQDALGGLRPQRLIAGRDFARNRRLPGVRTWLHRSRQRPRRSRPFFVRQQTGLRSNQSHRRLAGIPQTPAGKHPEKEVRPAARARRIRAGSGHLPWRGFVRVGAV